MSTPEGRVVKACLGYLELIRIHAWRNNSGCTSIEGANGRNRFVRYGLPGSADILGIMPDGRFLAVECKSDKGRLSELQQNFLDMIRGNGGVAFVARSVDDVEREIRAAIAPRGDHT